MKDNIYASLTLAIYQTKVKLVSSKIMSATPNKPPAKAPIKSQLEIDSNLICSGYCRHFNITSSDIIALIRIFYIISSAQETAFDSELCYGFVLSYISSRRVYRSVSFQ